jgi:N,N-dimethylformamidase
MLIGYVSDEQYVALADALVELEQDDRSVAVIRSTPRGALYADVAPGRYRATISRNGYGSKHVMVDIGEGQPYQFRLLSDRLVGYMWPKWTARDVRANAGSRRSLLIV